jgi:hypothetical protein
MAGITLFAVLSISLRELSGMDSAVGETHSVSAADAIRRAALNDKESQGLDILGIKPIYRRKQTVGWAVVLARSHTAQGPALPFPQISNVSLCLYGKEDENYRCFSRTSFLNDPRFGDDPAISVALECADLNEDELDEVLVTLNHPGASWTPGCALVFNLSSNKLAYVATITSHYPINLTRIDGRNQWVIPATYSIGKTQPHFSQPRWTDYYRFDGRQMMLANSFWPQRFRHWPVELRDLLKEHPDDAELWYYLGRAFQALGNELDAATAWKKAISLGYQQPDWKLLQAGLYPQKAPVSDPSRPSR